MADQANDLIGRALEALKKKGKPSTERSGFLELQPSGGPAAFLAKQLGESTYRTRQVVNELRKQKLIYTQAGGRGKSTTIFVKVDGKAQEADGRKTGNTASRPRKTTSKPKVRRGGGRKKVASSRRRRKTASISGLKRKSVPTRTQAPKARTHGKLVEATSDDIIGLIEALQQADADKDQRIVALTAERNELLSQLEHARGVLLVPAHLLGKTARRKRR